MDTLFLYNTKTLKEKFKTKVFAGDNHITKINVQIPDNIGGYPKSECEYNLRAIIPDGNLSYMIDPSYPYFYITNDITEKAQMVKLMMIITHEGNVIGRTNTVDLIVNEPAEAPDPPLTPRSEFDEVIAEQRAEIAEQAGTISEQATEIEAKDGQISELNDEITEKDRQITELNTENTRLENLTDTQRETIQNMLDNPPQPKLYTPPVITPSGSVQQVNPPTGYDGLNNAVVDRVTAEVDSDIQPQNIREGVDILGVEGTYNPFPEHSVGGIYITEVDEDGYPVKFLIKDYEHAPTIFPVFFDKSANAVSALREIVFENCPNITQIDGYFCNGLTYLKKCTLPNSITTLGRDVFSYSGLITFTAPSELINVGANAFMRCRNLKTVILNSKTVNLSYQMFYECDLLKTINIPASIVSVGNGATFVNCYSLEYVTIENGFNCNGLNLSSSTLYSVETIVSWLEALADRTGQTAYTITVGSTNLNKLTAEQRAIATNKNWNLA